MNNLTTLFDDLMTLCESTESFYYVDQTFLNNTYRVFSYRLASFTDFQHKNATECRGHTFLKTDNGWELVSLPMQKFWNWEEHLGWGEEIDLSGDIMIMDKLDGSLISTVYHDHNNPFPVLKSKTSFGSQQAQESTFWLSEQRGSKFFDAIQELIYDGRYTVNMEYTSPSNIIVLRYSEPKLTVLNARSLDDGHYMSYSDLIHHFGEENVVRTYEISGDRHHFISNVRNMEDDIEGFVVKNDSGKWFKLKTKKYSDLHKICSSIQNDRNLFEACVNEVADDVRAMFVNTPHYQRIVDMEEKVSKIYNHIHKSVYDFYNENKHLDRKSYAILGMERLNGEGTFSLAMNLYLGKDCDINGFMIKHYRDYGISDEEDVSRLYSYF